MASFKKRCPDLQTVLPLLKKVLVPAAAEAADATSQDSRASLLGHRVLVVLTKYLQLFPESFVEAKFDFGRLLVGDVNALEPAVQLQLCRVLRLATTLRWNNSSFPTVFDYPC
jgi:hypothetical protein